MSEPTCGKKCKNFPASLHVLLFWFVSRSFEPNEWVLHHLHTFANKGDKKTDHVKKPYSVVYLDWQTDALFNNSVNNLQG
jgi:hypothetical protein